MLAAVSAIVGILLAIIVLAVTRRRQFPTAGSTPQPTASGWCTLVFGLTAITAFTAAVYMTSRGYNPGMRLNLISITFVAASSLVGIGTLMKYDFHWPTWIGLFAGLIPAVFWFAFAVGNIMDIGN